MMHSIQITVDKRQDEINGRFLICVVPFARGITHRKLECQVSQGCDCVLHDSTAIGKRVLLS